MGRNGLSMSRELLNPEKALIFRITHRENVRAMFRDGLHCRNSLAASGSFVQIGNPELIERRQSRIVECPPHGTLSDYIPFYFTPYTPMMYNIKTGYNGVQRRPMEDIVILVSSLRWLVRDGIPFVFSDRHAYLRLARFTSNLAHLSWIDWPSLQARNFRKDDADRFERYQAEALVHKHMPTKALLGVVCYSESVRSAVESLAAKKGLGIRVRVREEWYL